MKNKLKFEHAWETEHKSKFQNNAVLHNEENNSRGKVKELNYSACMRI